MTKLKLNLGPQHPSTHGVLRLILELEGEKILSCEPDVGYLHRGMEKMAEKLSYIQYLPLVDRIDYLGGFFYSVNGVKNFMFRKIREKQRINLLQKSIDKLTDMLQNMNLHDLIYILGSKKEIIKRNLLAGIARGIGGGIGFTIITAIIIYFLQKIVRLNIPIIGEYINDIVEIVEGTK